MQIHAQGAQGLFYFLSVSSSCDDIHNGLVFYDLMIYLPEIHPRSSRGKWLCSQQLGERDWILYVPLVGRDKGFNPSSFHKSCSFSLSLSLSLSLLFDVSCG